MPYQYSPIAQEEEDYKKRLQTFTNTRQSQASADLGNIRSEALRRGLTGDLFEAAGQASNQAAASTDISNYGASLGQEASQRALEDRRMQEQRAYGTSERIAGQEYGTSERLGSQAFGAGEALKGREYGTSERIGSQGFQAGESAAERALREKLGTSQLAQQQSQYAEELIQRGYDRDKADQAASDAAKAGTIGSLIGTVGGIAGAVIGAGKAKPIIEGAKSLIGLGGAGAGAAAGAAGAGLTGGVATGAASGLTAGTTAGAGAASGAAGAGIASAIGSVLGPAVPVAMAALIIQRLTGPGGRFGSRTNRATGPQDAEANLQEAKNVLSALRPDILAEQGGVESAIQRLPREERGQFEEIDKKMRQEMTASNQANSAAANPQKDYASIQAKYDNLKKEKLNEIKAMYEDTVAGGIGASMPKNREPGEDYKAFKDRDGVGLNLSQYKQLAQGLGVEPGKVVETIAAKIKGGMSQDDYQAYQTKILEPNRAGG